MKTIHRPHLLASALRFGANLHLTRLRLFGLASAPALGAFCVVALAPVAALAQSLSTTQEVLAGNIGHGDNAIAFNGSSDGSASTASARQSFKGLNQAGTLETMTFDGTVTSSATYGQLHSYAAGTVDNTYYNANDPAYYDSNTGTDPAGSPNSLGTLGFANFSDTLQYGGALQSGYQARYVFHISGNNIGYGGAAELDVSIAGNSMESFFDFNAGPLSTDFATLSYPVNGTTPQTINVRFSDQFVLNTNDVPDGSNISGMSDFADTATFAGVEILDANGNPVSGVTVTSGSGTVYSIVPEPTTWAILLPAAFLLLGRRRRIA